MTANGHQDTFTITAEGLIALSADAKSRTIKLSTPDLSKVYAQAKLDAHPVGSIYESTVSTSPATLFGGTWVAMDAGRVLVAQGKAATGTTFTAGATGGEEKHKLTTSEMPAHDHTMSSAGEHNHEFAGTQSSSDDKTTEYEQTGDYSRTRAWLKTNYTQKSGSHTHTINSTGGGEAHNNLQPYEVVYRWKRTA